VKKTGGNCLSKQVIALANKQAMWCTQPGGGDITPEQSSLCDKKKAKGSDCGGPVEKTKKKRKQRIKGEGRPQKREDSNPKLEVKGRAFFLKGGKRQEKLWSRKDGYRG